MARIAGVDLPRDKRLKSRSPTSTDWKTAANKILEKTGIHKDTKVNKLNETEVVRLREEIEQEYKVEGDLRRDVTTNIKRLMDIGLTGAETPEVSAGPGTENAYEFEDTKGSRRAVMGKKKEKE